MGLELLSESFRLKLLPILYFGDSAHPTDTRMDVTVYSDEFSASTSMDIDIRDLEIFAENLCRIYDTLSGEARIEEPFGHMYLQFTGDGRGHIAVEGFLFGRKSDVNQHSLEFENSIDQTELRSFCFALRDACNGYLK